MVGTIGLVCETWNLYMRHIKQLEELHQKSLRMVMSICWQDRIKNQEVLDRAETTSIESMLLKGQLCWTDHVIRMDDSRIPRQLMYGELKLGSRKQGRPKLRDKDTLKSNIKLCGIQPRQLEAAAADLPVWTSLTSTATVALDEDRRQHLAAARDRCHGLSSITVQTTGYRGDSYRRLCASSFLLPSQMCSHR